MRTTARRLAAAAAVLGALGLAGCAGPAAHLKPGASQAEVRQAMGALTAQYPLPGGGQRLEFASGPFGRTTYMMDMGPDGRLLRWAQVLNEMSFLGLRPGMTMDEVRLYLGTPAATKGTYTGPVWYWRYPTNDCLWFALDFTHEGRVRTGGGYDADPMCDKPSPPR